MKQNRCILPIIGLWVALALFGYGEASSAPQPRGKNVPVVEEPGPPCKYIEWLGPVVNGRIICAEIVYDHVIAPEAAPELAGLAFGSDDTLYVARTALGEIWAMRDEDGDQFMDEPFPVAEGLRLPLALAFEDDALFVLSAEAVTRLDASDNERFDNQMVLLDEMGAPTGFWPGSIGIGPDKRLYISLGASCALCDGVHNIQPGQIVSYALDGTDRRIEAVGLRDPADFSWHPDTGELWVVDSGQVSSLVSADGPPDELNRVTPGADFGFPQCSGGDPSKTDCADTIPPSVVFPHQSSPGGIEFYTHEGFSSVWTGDLIVVLRGSTNRLEPAGYSLEVVGFDGGQPDGSRYRITPNVLGTDDYASFSLAKFSLLGRGFFPYHPTDVAIDSRGWVYVSVAEGRIFRFRPRPTAR